MKTVTFWTLPIKQNRTRRFQRVKLLVKLLTLHLNMSVIPWLGAEWRAMWPTENQIPRAPTPGSGFSDSLSEYCAEETTSIMSFAMDRLYADTLLSPESRVYIYL